MKEMSLVMHVLKVKHHVDILGSTCTYILHCSIDCKFSEVFYICSATVVFVCVVMALGSTEGTTHDELTYTHKIGLGTRNVHELCLNRLQLGKQHQITSFRTSIHMNIKNWEKCY